MPERPRPEAPASIGVPRSRLADASTATDARPTRDGARVPRIDPRRLLVLRAFVLSDSVTATAAALHLTPSAVSQQLAALEREVGHALVVRTGRKLALTPAGRILAGHAEEINSRLKIAEADLAAHAGGVLGQLRIGAFPTAISWLVAPAIVELRRQAPGVDVTVVDAEVHMSHRMLMRGDIDVTVSLEYESDPERDSPDIVKFPLYIERFKAWSSPTRTRWPVRRASGSPSSPRRAGSCPRPVTRAARWCCRRAPSSASTRRSPTSRTTTAPRWRWSPPRRGSAGAGVRALRPRRRLGDDPADARHRAARKVIMTTRRDNQGHPVVRAGLEAMRAVVAEPDSEIYGPLARSDTFSVE